MKKTVVMLMTMVAAGLSFADEVRRNVYEELMPAPQRVETRTAAAVSVDCLAKPEVRRGVVAGAPAAVADQSYMIDIAAGQVSVVAGGEAGARYALTTLRQLAKLADGGDVPSAVITDWPTLKWRGVMNDCGRNFLALEGVKAIIDLAADYKMNLFHWHLADYHGWRLESKKYPRLNAPETMTRQIGKFYTQDEFKAMVAYAKSRGVVIMPEFDVPGHTLALRKGLGVETMKAPCVDRAVSELIDELCALASKEAMPFIHLGTDEVRVDPEYVDAEQCSRWAETVARNGRITVAWAPGQAMKSSGEIIDMVWHDNRITNTTRRVFDSARMYFASAGPQLILNQAAFTKPCRWQTAEGRQLGAIACAWHDDNVGDDTLRLFANATIAPGILLFADTYWKGCRRDAPEFSSRLPAADTEDFRSVAALERRLVAQRDKALNDFPFAFPYVAQTEQRWRVSRPDGTVVARECRGALIDARALVPEKHGELVAEMWVRSDVARTVGAWIDFVGTGTAYVRQENGTMPDIGEWNRSGSTVSVNGEEIAPPVWRNPRAQVRWDLQDADGKSYKGAVYSNNVSETPLENEWSFIREPTPVTLRKGWNHVRLNLRHQSEDKGIYWRGVFQLIDGTSAHPREVKGLEYSAEPKTDTRL